ncbi:LysR family transcriptional regulator [Pseudomonas sp. 148P]|uniref:LysR family transcriptional regulator n=1 Tax=Pseudomonas ulcerans TaxID=3115852 RepID=A0ABU7HSV8_9PSED|nr:MULTISPECIES: LysR family transcriptional regulator [unclassified Pseudomonas]MEE1920671.1 LysR family transcriptional regulator [Pseudomonas sp. 147P]MEE1934614.1 LysR family transcriptional regulator [Pseudomonas sp. 148P]
MDRFDAMQTFVRVVETGSFSKAAGTLHMSDCVPAHPRDLEDSQHRTVGYFWVRTGKPLSHVMKKGEETQQVRGRPVLTVDDGNAYLAAGITGMGTVAPRYMAEDAVTRRELVELFTDWALESMPIYLAFPPNRHVSAKLRVFIDCMVELMARHAPVTGH